MSNVEALMQFFVVTSKMVVALDTVEKKQATKHEIGFPNLFQQIGGCLEKLERLGEALPINSGWVKDSEVLSEVTFYQDNKLTDDYFDQVAADKKSLSGILISLQESIDDRLKKMETVGDEAFELVRAHYQQAKRIVISSAE